MVSPAYRPWCCCSGCSSSPQSLRGPGRTWRRTTCCPTGTSRRSSGCCTGCRGGGTPPYSSAPQSDGHTVGERGTAWALLAWGGGWWTVSHFNRYSTFKTKVLHSKIHIYIQTPVLTEKQNNNTINQFMYYFKCSLTMEMVSEHLWIIPSIHW